ncbi:hypothetical protein GGR50DRAFT_691505 [Xylaria sp. CBS 124048]|nr:hypothetical protein GGR50DRAFT_691505 [Xylaria sp. CBS 124048]
MHVEAGLRFRAPTDSDIIHENERFGRLAPHSRCRSLLALGLDDERDDIEVLRARNTYRVFQDFVDYPELYRDEEGIWSKSSPNDAGPEISTLDGIKSSPLGKKSSDCEFAADSAVPKRAATCTLALPRSDVLESFGGVKILTDELMQQLGMPFHTAVPGQELERVPFLPHHHHLIECIYEILERDARLVDIDIEGKRLTRTHVAVPLESIPNRMTLYAGQRLAGVLSGKTDGIRAIFGTPKGRELVQAMYCEPTFNYMNYLQIRDVISRLLVV